MAHSARRPHVIKFGEVGGGVELLYRPKEFASVRPERSLLPETERSLLGHCCVGLTLGLYAYGIEFQIFCGGL